MKALSFRRGAELWGRELVLLASSVFLISFGQGLFRGASTNFFVESLNMSGKQVLWLTGLREIPGLALMFIAAAMMHLRITHRAAMAIGLMAVGYGLYAVVHSFTALVAMAIIASLGFHVWMPLQSALGLALAPEGKSGRVLGNLSAVAAMASIVGMGAIALISRLVTDFSLRFYYVAGGLLMAVAALLILRLPVKMKGSIDGQRRLLLKKRYWLYYVLTFFEGSRMQVFGAFGTLVLVEHYGLQVWHISLLLLVSSAVNLGAAPLFGHILDRFGERWTLSVSYVLLTLCFVGYATIHSAPLLALFLILINALVLLRIGLSTYVGRIAPPEELEPTLSAGVSVNHVTSVSMSLVAGFLLEIVGYEWLCFGAAAIIMTSVPFAMALEPSGTAWEASRPVPVE